MMKRLYIIFLLVLVPVLAAAQDGANKNATPPEKAEKIKTGIPVQAMYSNSFTINPFYFNKRIDTRGRGEILEVELVFQNETDSPLDLYIFVIASYEKTEKTKSSFEMPISEKERIRTFVPFPDNMANFQHDNSGKGEKTRLVKFPKNPREGVDPKTGKSYSLEDKLLVRTTHLSPYKKNYYFFNNVTVLVFDSEGKPMFRQEYELKGIRR